MAEKLDIKLFIKVAKRKTQTFMAYGSWEVF
jgi:hypothetical protein